MRGRRRFVVKTGCRDTQYRCHRRAGGANRRWRDGDRARGATWRFGRQKTLVCDVAECRCARGNRCHWSTRSRRGTPVTQFFCALRHASVHPPRAGTPSRGSGRAREPSGRALHLAALGEGIWHCYCSLAMWRRGGVASQWRACAGVPGDRGTTVPSRRTAGSRAIHRAQDRGAPSPAGRPGVIHPPRISRQIRPEPGIGPGLTEASAS
jgi:hypothetical protein